MLFEARRYNIYLIQNAISHIRLYGISPTYSISKSNLKDTQYTNFFLQNIRCSGSEYFEEEKKMKGCRG